MDRLTPEATRLGYIGKATDYRGSVGAQFLGELLGWKETGGKEMRQWLWKLILTVGLAMTLGCTTRTNLDSDADFKPLLGKVLKTKKDLVVIKFKDDQKKFILAIPGSQDVPAIDKMPKKFPFDYYNQRTYGILPAGSTLEIVHLERVATIEFAFVEMYAKIASIGAFKDFVLDVKDVTDQTKKPPTFDKEYVEEAPPTQ